MKTIAWIIVVGCMVILQYHSIGFWLDMSSSFIGYVISPIVEISSLFYWYTSEKKTAFILSAVVVFASVFHLSKGSIENWTHVNNAETKKESIASVNKTLNRINDQNLSWWKTSKKAMDTMVILHQDSNTTKVSTTKEVIFLNVAVEIAMIVMVLVAQIKAILFLAKTDIKTVKRVSLDEDKRVNKQAINSVELSSKVVLAKEVIEIVEQLNKQRGDLSINKTMLFLGIENRTIYTNIKAISNGVKASISEDKIKEIKKIIMEKKDEL